MYTENEIIAFLKNHVKESRYIHTMGVVETAEKLAKIYNVDIRKTRIAALIHDCAKNLSVETMFQILEENNCVIDEVMKINTGLLHSEVSAIIAENTFKIEDREILDAAKYHTIGRENMSVLDKIIYLADYIEPGRSFKGVEELRKIAFYEDLDKALIAAIDNTIKFVVDRKQLLHPNSILMRNRLLIVEREHESNGK
ncbi:bis(5'-nucleosyl)-tetraphosphatase (symmetrical) YqeK [Clostridium cellulovorans]|uniref:bis(5'-nucleosyl)-tetraphosphatase (symmetrical) n=1 Tax=Clostridium cellulovorans (strain ATCC 35296 / DSM 3052 / OCM 3 / 743B) TaxID=573061 RepID=D9SRZ6_CLOC7|nr:bis(5'-nucleosyl)-tetraphosphatase (symmetrical) YqeK [Clostridium cellulovorans]ADL52443.1 metal dependent phosphohydrolase [Clostridium cellulovorans 743B]